MKRYNTFTEMGITYDVIDVPKKFFNGRFHMFATLVLWLKMVRWYYGHGKPMYTIANTETIKRIGLGLALAEKKEGEESK